MHKYRVVQRWAEENRMALRCSEGRCHLTLALRTFPLADALLEGARPHLGFDLLQCPKSGAIFRVIFESIGNSEMPLAPSAMPGATHRSQGASQGMSGGAD